MEGKVKHFLIFMGTVLLSIYVYKTFLTRFIPASIVTMIGI